MGRKKHGAEFSEMQDKMEFVHADVLQYLKTLSPQSFDLIVLDPPTFSNSKRMKDILDVQRIM